MMLSINPSPFLKGRIKLPPSKSYSIRCVMIAACGGSSNIQNVSSCDDVRIALKIIKHLGAQVVDLKKDKIQIISCLREISKSFYFHVGESGTVLRFVLPLVALKARQIKIDARGTLRNRPNRPLIEVLKRMGVQIEGQGIGQTVPIVIHGGSLKGGSVRVDGSLSSQFISALLITAPLLKEKTKILISGKKIVSQTYIQMTLEVLRRAGIRIQKTSNRCFLVPAQQRYRGLKNFIIPSDYGLAAFWLGAGALVSSKIRLDGYFDQKLVQADAAIIPFLKKMGVDFKQSKTCLQVQGPFSLEGGSFCLKDCPDLLPLMAVLALFAKRTTRFYGIAHARIKESDRVSDLRRELEKVGAKMKEKKGELIINPQNEYKAGVLLDPHQDHRLAMAFAILGIKIGVRVKNIECVSKSYPHFVSDLQKIKAKTKKFKIFEG